MRFMFIKYFLWVWAGFAAGICHGQAHFAITLAEAPARGDSLDVVFWPVFVHASEGYGRQLFRVAPDGDGVYRFSVEAAGDRGRLKVVKPKNRGYVFDCVPVRVGDSIVVAEHRDGFVFRGTGASAYQLDYERHGLEADVDRHWERWKRGAIHARAFVLGLDSLAQSVFGRFATYEAHTDADRFALLLADHTGLVRRHLLTALTAHVTDSAQRKDWEPLVAEILGRVPLAVPETLALRSRTWPDYLYHWSKLRLFFAQHKGFGEWDYLGNVRALVTPEALHAALVADHTPAMGLFLRWFALFDTHEQSAFWHGRLDEAFYLATLSELHAQIADPFLRELVRWRLATGRGSDAYPFAFTDLEGKVVQLGDLRGKVILMEVWGEGCGGCIQFKRDFVEKAYPALRGCEDFVVLSVNWNFERERWVKALPLHSDPSFVNLHMGPQGRYHPMVAHYGFNAIPFVLVIDRAGKVVTTTVRDVGVLRALIEEALGR